ncbi:MAG: hypothetical protein ACOC0M_00945, partial [Halomonas sp.]
MGVDPRPLVVAVMIAASALDELGARLLLVSPSPGSDQWAHVSDLPDARTADAGNVPGLLPAAAVADHAAAQAVADAFDALPLAWRAGDAARINTLLSVLTQQLPRINPQTYPSSLRRGIEAIYNGSLRYVLAWGGYFVATVALILAFATGRRWVVGIGIAALVFAWLVNTLTFAARALLSGRWPIHNQYESFIAIAWFAVGVGVVLMIVKRQWLFGAAAAALGFASMLFADTVPIPSRGVGQVAGILATSRILYVHVNLALVSYALISLSFFVSLFYLAAHYLPMRETTRIAAAGVGAVAGDATHPGLAQGLAEGADLVVVRAVAVSAHGARIDWRGRPVYPAWRGCEPARRVTIRAFPTMFRCSLGRPARPPRDLFPRPRR